MIAIYVSCLDRNNHLGSLDRKDSLKSKISRHLANIFPIQDGPEMPRHVKILVALIRPSWLGRNVAAELLKSVQPGTEPRVKDILQV